MGHRVVSSFTKPLVFTPCSAGHRELSTCCTHVRQCVHSRIVCMSVTVPGLLARVLQVPSGLCLQPGVMPNASIGIGSLLVGPLNGEWQAPALCHKWGTCARIQECTFCTNLHELCNTC